MLRSCECACPALVYKLSQKLGDFELPNDTFRIMSMKVSNELELPVIALHGAGRIRDRNSRHSG